MSENSQKPSKNKREKKQVSSNRKRAKKIILSVFLVGVIVVSVAVIAFVSTIVNLRKNDDVLLDLDSLELNLTTIIYSVNSDTGEETELKRLYRDENRVWVNLDQIPVYTQNAFIAIEDKRFRKHEGVDWRRTAGALVNFLGSDDGYGGSTITQQLIKNITQDDDFSVTRKATEILRALDVEKQFSKEVILEAYLNTINLGSTNQGVQTAARYYFNKDVADLTLAESACIAGITQSPWALDPYNDKEANKDRQEHVLAEMLEQGFITQEEHDKAVTEELKFQKDPQKDVLEINNWFVDQVIMEIVGDLEEQKGMSEEDAYNYLYNGGLRIYATVDTEVQKILEENYNKGDIFEHMSQKELDTYKAGEAVDRPTQSCMVILDNKGGIKGVVGGTQKTTSLELNRATSVPKQTGSSMKPLGAYAPAVSLGAVGPGTVMVDEPYLGVKNFSGTYSGKVTIQKALNESLNTIPMKIVNQIGPDVAFEYVRDTFRISTLNERDRAEAPMALGALTDGITPLEMAAAYNVFATGGYYYKPHSYTMVRQALTDEVILENSEVGEQTMDSDTAGIMNTMLQQVASNVGSGIISGQASAGKTGTTNMGVPGYSNYVRDLWFCGYTPYYTAVVWEGYDTDWVTDKDGNRVKASGSEEYQVQHLGYKNTAEVRQMYNRVMTEVHGNLPYKAFAEAQNLVSAKICTDTGLLAGEYCEHTTTGMFKQGGLPTMCPGHPDVKAKREEEEKKKKEEEKKKKEEEKKKKEEEERKKQEEERKRQEEEDRKKQEEEEKEKEKEQDQKPTPTLPTEPEEE